MQTHEIKKVKLKRGMFLQVDYTLNTEDDTQEISKSSNSVVHDDLKQALKNLSPHLRDLCEQAADSEMEVTGFTITGGGEGIVLTGTRKLLSGKTLNLNSPNERWENSEYSASQELGELLETAKGEVSQYLFEGKHAPKAQQELDFDEMDAEPEQLEDV